MTEKKPIKTYTICENCNSLVHRWYSFEEGEFCVRCYIELFPENMTQFDYDLLEEEEKNNGQ